MELKFDYKISGKILKDGAGSIDIMREELGKGFEEGTAFVMRKVSMGTPYYRGAAQSSIQREVNGEGLNVHGRVFSNLSYINFLETGLPAHAPTFGSLAEWVHLKLGHSGREVFAITKVISRNISRAGITGRFMFKKGLEGSQNYLNKIFDNVSKKIADRLGKD
jgi:hypothetical protein